MTDKERLEEIKSRVWKDKSTYVMGDYSQREGYIYTLSDYDYEWLVKQAERVEKLEIRLSINTNNMKQLQKENKRLTEKSIKYRELLSDIANLSYYKEQDEEYYESLLKRVILFARYTLEGEK